LIKQKNVTMKLKLLLLTALMAVMSIAYGQITTVGLIGEFIGWADPDVDMVQDATDPDIWTLEITLPDGPVKFRADDGWAINWGSGDFPAGVGVQDGSDIPVWAGDYFITFNSATGEYFFDVDSPIGIIGDATPGGWEEDTDMYQMQDNEHGFFVELFLNQGACKFRKDNDWIVNWGGEDFPTGVGVQDGPDIPVDKAGDYYVTLDTMTGEYSFEEIITFETVSIIGDATPGGWDNDTYLTQSGANPDIWMLNVIELTDGVAKFRANDSWTINWGGTDFPSGIGEQDGPDIPCVAGLYQVSLNTATGEYNFLPIVYYSTIGIIGDATPGGWVEDTDMEVDPTDSAKWSLRIELTTGSVKFRADNDWPVNWGAADFPSGVAVQDGADIPVPEGEYFITFNSTTGEYNFQEIIVYDRVGLVGTGSPNASWDIDVFMDNDAVNENKWTLSTVTLFAGECKFRADSAWTVNWGAIDWPTGFGTQDGPNIPTVAGTYGVTLYSDTGEYAFGNPLSANNVLLDPRDITLYPNPVANTLHVDMGAADLKGTVHLTVLDNTGRVILNHQTSASTARLDVSSLQSGNYIIRIQAENALIGKYFSIVK
jgi:hypothetical protein